MDATGAVANKAALRELLEREDNTICADCRAPAPQWASASVGCFICTEYADDDGQKSRSDARKFANFEVNSVSSMQMCNFKNHHNCPGHKRNVMKYLGLDAAAAEQGADLSPSKEDFEKVWNHVCAGGPLPLIIIIIIIIITIIIIRWNCSGGH